MNNCEMDYTAQDTSGNDVELTVTYNINGDRAHTDCPAWSEVVITAITDVDGNDVTNRYRDVEHEGIMAAIELDYERQVRLAKECAI